jgi:cysteine dioxygenase
MMNSIESLEELIEKLDQSDSYKLGRIIKQISIPITNFEAYASWNNNAYTRNCIKRTNEYELILLCWNKGDATPIHGHGGQNCWVYQIEGQMTEVRYERIGRGKLIEKDRIQLDPGMLTFMNNAMGYHKLSNDSFYRAMSLHLYVSPITSCEVFNDRDETFGVIELEYDTINGNALTEVE